MRTNWRFLSIIILLSLFVCWRIVVFQRELTVINSLFLDGLARQTEVLEKLEEMKPLPNRRYTESLEISAASAIAVLVDKKGEVRVLFEKNSDEELPIASISKLMTARTVLEHYDLSQEIKISKEAVLQGGDFGKLEVGKIFSAEYLLYPLLIESSNDAAYALAEVIGQEAFVELMNLEAKNLGLKNTYFVNPTGLDSKDLSTLQNYSTVKDLVQLTKYLLKEQPLIWKILVTPKFDLYGLELINTNKLLGEISGIIGGKTGETPLAGQCLLLVVQAPKDKGFIVNIILNSENRFEEMKKLINWTKNAYKW